MKARLTDKLAAELRIPDGGREAAASDDRIPGFTLRALPSGRRLWLLRYKIDGTARKVTLGEWPGMTAAAARKAAETLRGEVSGSRDVWAARKAERTRLEQEAAAQQFTVERLIAAWEQDALANRGPRHRRDAPRMLRMGLAKWLATPAARFDAEAARAALKAIASRGSPISANRVRAYGSAAFAWAMKDGQLGENPFRLVPKVADERGRDRVLSDEELALVWRAAEQLGAPWVGLLRLLILTGQRRSEVAEMRWSEIRLDGEAPAWMLPAGRTKNSRAHDVPLVAAAVEIIRACPRVAGRDFVLSAGGAMPPSSFGKMKRRLDAAIASLCAQEERAPMAGWTLHDLRRTVATGLQRLGVRLEVTEAVLNHISGSRSGIVGIYQRHQWTAEKRAALEAWARHVAAITDPTSNVISLTSARSSVA